MQNSFLTIIPARGGSKGLKNKNILKFCGKQLIYKTIKLDLKCKFFKNIVVSTDSKKIQKISKKYGADVPFLRPSNISKDSSSSYLLIKHCINYFKKKKIFFKYVVLLEPTSPIRLKKDLNNAISNFLKKSKKIDSLVSVGEVFEHPYVIKKITKGKLEDFIRNSKNYTHRQSLPKLYFPYGVIYISCVDTYLKNKKFSSKKTGYYCLKNFQNIEIDDKYSFIAAENIFKKLNLHIEK